MDHFMVTTVVNNDMIEVLQPEKGICGNGKASACDCCGRRAVMDEDCCAICEACLSP